MLRNTSEDKMIKGLILSLQFFTRIPINIPIDFSKENLKYGVFFLPLVGGIIGGLGGLIYYLLAPYNLMIASFLSLLATIILTGGLHIDGLSDTFDGFFSNKDKEKTLEIMRDSRVGAFGVLSIVLQILFKFILILNIPNLPIALALSFANSRWIMSLMMCNKKSARSNGLGKMFNDTKPKKIVILSGIIYITILVVLDIKYIIPLIINFLLAEWISYISCKKIDGVTGDVYGCMAELGETISLLTFWGVSLWI